MKAHSPPVAVVVLLQQRGIPETGVLAIWQPLHSTPPPTPAAWKRQQDTTSREGLPQSSAHTCPPTRPSKLWAWRCLQLAIPTFSLQHHRALGSRARLWSQAAWALPANVCPWLCVHPPWTCLLTHQPPVVSGKTVHKCADGKH